MACVYNRIFAYCKNNKLPLLSLNDRMEIGKLVNDAWRSDPNWKWINKVEKKEPGGTFKVWNYPKEFKPKIDVIIANFNANNSISKLPTTVSREIPAVKRRKKILKPAYSASPVNNLS